MRILVILGIVYPMKVEIIRHLITDTRLTA